MSIHTSSAPRSSHTTLGWPAVWRTISQLSACCCRYAYSTNINRVVFGMLLLLSTGLSYAQCSHTAISQAEDDRSALIKFGKINISNQYLQPFGSLLATTVVPATEYTFAGANAQSILWSCDVADLPSIYFLVATNGDDRLGGHWESGAMDGLTAVFATWWKFVGIKQSMSGVEINRFWQKVPIKSYQQSNGKIHIRLMDIPPLEVSLYKISQLPPETGSNSNYCTAMVATGIYSCNQPNSYIQLSGDAKVSFKFNHDMPGQDSNTNYSFWGADNGFGYALRGSGSLVKAETCAVRNVTPNVYLPLISSAELQQGLSSQADFRVEIECSDQATSGVGDLHTAIGFQVSDTAYLAATSLSQVQATGAVEYLLSDQYAIAPNIATGVGIRLINSSNQKKMQFLRPMSNVGGGEAAGWYPILDGKPQNLGSIESGYQRYSQNYTAILEAIPKQIIRPGLVKATATVVVKVQ